MIPFLKKHYQTLSASSKNVLILVGGTIAAQVIPIAITPLITRIYEPDMFGILALFTSLVSIAAPFSTGSYELSIMIPKHEKQARYITWICIYLSFIFSIIAGIFLIILKQEIINKFHQPLLYPVLYLAPFTIFIAGAYQGLHYYHVRKKEFKLLSKIQIYKSAISSTIQIAVGLFSKGPLGLILGYISLFCTGSLNLFKKFIEKTKEKSIIKHHKKKTFFLVKKYKKFPLLSSLAIFFSNSSEHIKTIFIGSMFSPFILGQYALANRLMNLPFTFIANSVSQVYFQEASEEKNKYGHTKKTFYTTTKKLILLSGPIFLLIFFFITPIVKITFGNKWILAGHYTKILLPFFLIRFIVSPNTVLVNIFEKQTFFAIWQGLFVIFTILVLAWTKKNHLGIDAFVHIYVIMSTILYSILFIQLWRFSQGK